MLPSNHPDPSNLVSTPGPFPFGGFGVNLRKGDNGPDRVPLQHKEVIDPRVSTCYPIHSKCFRDGAMAVAIDGSPTSRGHTNRTPTWFGERRPFVRGWIIRAKRP